jgi:hypothetical protein
MTTLETSDSILCRTQGARARAESVLEGLCEAKTESERRLSESRRSDPLKQVTGRSSLDNAIDTTRRMIDTLDRNLVELERETGGSGGYVVVPRGTELVQPTTG